MDKKLLFSLGVMIVCVGAAGSLLFNQMGIDGLKYGSVVLAMTLGCLYIYSDAKHQPSGYPMPEPSGPPGSYTLYQGQKVLRLTYGKQGDILKWGSERLELVLGHEPGTGSSLADLLDSFRRAMLQASPKRDSKPTLTENTDAFIWRWKYQPEEGESDFMGYYRTAAEFEAHLDPGKKIMTFTEVVKSELY